MATSNIKFKCSNCDATYSKWAGKCSQCESWNSLEEYIPPAILTGVTSTGKGIRASKVATGNIPERVTEIAKTVNTTLRVVTGISEFDRVLGGGLVPGGVILLAGEPGVGKSSCAMIVAAALAKQGKKVLYITGEETASQVAGRALRIGATNSDGTLGQNLYLLAEGNLQNAIAQLINLRPDFVIVDSVQTLLSDDSEGRIGSVTQVSEVATDFTNIAKRLNIPTILIGHVTKDGNIAGPRVIEHLVDVVLFFESSNDSPLRLLRAVKSRFGSTEEIGCFIHTADGFEEVTDPNGFFTNPHAEGITGFAISATLEGRRVIPVEIQSLVSPTKLPNPRKISQGVEHGRGLQLQAIIDKYLGFRLFDQDVYISTTGGLRLSDPGTDLAIIASLISSKTSIPLLTSEIFIGEVTLTGEVRTPRDRDKRIKECSRLFDTIYTSSGKDITVPNNVKLIIIKDVYELGLILKAKKDK